MKIKLQTPFNSLPNLFRLRTRDAFLDIPVLEDTECRHLADTQLLRNAFAFFDIVCIEFDLWWAVSGYRCE